MPTDGNMLVNGDENAQEHESLLVAEEKQGSVSTLADLDNESFATNDRMGADEENEILLTFRIRKSFLYRCIITAALGSLLLGYDLGIISGALIPLRDDLNLSHQKLELLTSSILFTSIIGSVIAGVVADMFGRKAGLICASLIFGGGSIGCAASQSFNELLAWRCVIGIGVGMGLVICPIFCAELAPRRERGSLTSFNELFINVGIPLAYLAGLLIRGMENDWRWMLGSGVIPAAALFFATLFLPESPSWLMKHDRRKEARIVVENLVDPSEDPGIRAKAVKLTLQDLHDDMKEQKNMATWGELLFSRGSRPALLIGTAFAALQQLIGTDSMIFYSVYALTHFGVSETLALQVTLIMGLLKLAFTIVASLVVDIKGIGRRLPLLIGAVGCCIGMFIMFSATVSGEVNPVTSGVLITGILVFISAFGLGYGPMCWLILAEIFQGPFRSKGLSIGSVTNRLASFAVVASYLSLIHSAGLDGTYLIYFFVCVVALGFSFWFIPELNGRKIGSDNVELKRRCCMK
mmetsp:Transcript_31588/g.77072  ORF Transcript_31588/g.77072 Transcript_31588/m.77072 type:complete len:522 (-) Transcript_31588:257-1822(-)